MKSVLVLLHCESNTGYAITPLEATFFRMALTACDQDLSRVHFAYPGMSRGPTPTLPPTFNQYLIVDAATKNPEDWQRAADYIAKHSIDTIFGFDQPVGRPIYRHFRRAGVKRFISYWGAPMSSIFGPVKLMLKRIEVALRRHGPDHYIFESHGMAETAIRGRGIPARKTSVVYQGIDAERFRPPPQQSDYVYEHLGIPRNRKVLVYSGHMEERKGIATIMRAANRLAEMRDDDWQMLLLGNRDDEALPYQRLLSPKAADHVLFGGYRSDLERILPSCYAGMIATSGWDSFPRSPLEMQACGLPMAVSRMPGLRESIEDGHTGFLFTPGDDQELSAVLSRLLEEPTTRNTMAVNARRRIENQFTLEHQFRNLLQVFRSVAG